MWRHEREQLSVKPVSSEVGLYKARLPDALTPTDCPLRNNCDTLIIVADVAARNAVQCEEKN
jgi:hypothetical protein